MNDTNQRTEGFSLFPRTFWGALSVAIICATVIIIVYLTAGHKSQASRIWTPVVVETNGVQTTRGGTRQMEFWTPSAKTKDYLAENGGKMSEKEKWQVIASDDLVYKFGSMLHTNAYVLGYRRVEVWGHGRTSFKPGWWWSVNVTTNCPVSELAQIYYQFWKSPSPAFFEVMDSQAGGK